MHPTQAWSQPEHGHRNSQTGTFQSQQNHPIHKPADLCIHTIHPCCGSRCWRDNEPALFHTHRCLPQRKVQARQETGKARTGVVKGCTHPRTCCREASSRVCSRGICSPLGPNTSCMSSSMLPGMKDGETASQFFTASNGSFFRTRVGNNLHRLPGFH